MKTNYTTIVHYLLLSNPISNTGGKNAKYTKFYVHLYV